MKDLSFDKKIEWPNHIVEPVLITYNRSKYLKKTLQSFVDAGLTSMKLHILDNCSPDDTKELVQSFQTEWPLLKYHCNRYNINGNGNYLRALEIGETKYCWIIGDDDEWYLDDLTELIEILNDQSADVIRLGWQVEEWERGKLASFIEMIAKSNQFLCSVGMISSVIVKRDFITSDMSQSYFTIGDSYPQLVPFFQNCHSEKLTVYSLKKNIMKHTPNPEAGYFLDDLEWLSCFCRSTRHIKDSAVRTETIKGLLEYIIVKNNSSLSFMSIVRILLFYSLKSKAYGFDQTPYFFTLLGYGTGHRVHVFIAFIIYLCCPLFLLRPFTMWARKKRGFDGDLNSARRFFLDGRNERP